MAIITRSAVRRLTLLFVFLLALLFVGWLVMFRMPGVNYDGPMREPIERESTLAQALREDVEELAGRIGERHVRNYEALVAAAEYIERELEGAGISVTRQTYPVDGVDVWNIEAELPGTRRKDEFVVVGAHYDSVPGCPGANDNATGVAAVLALARSFASRSPERTIRFVFFVNEEPPYFQTEEMGSLVYARRCRERKEDIRAMLSLETMGYYDDAPGSQRYPPLIGMAYPSTGNFIGFVGNLGSRGLLHQVIERFRDGAWIPSEGAALPGWSPGAGLSDHWSFWKAGYPGIMVTDTAPFRYPHYHRSTDTPEHLDYVRLARVVLGLKGVLTDLTQGE